MRTRNAAEEGSVPYDIPNALLESVRRNLPDRAQEIHRAAYYPAEEQ